MPRSQKPNGLFVRVLGIALLCAGVTACTGASDESSAPNWVAQGSGGVGGSAGAKSGSGGMVSSASGSGGAGQVTPTVHDAGSAGSGSAGSGSAGSGGGNAMNAGSGGVAHDSGMPALDAGTGNGSNVVGGSSVGTGEIDHPVVGPAATRAADVGGAAFVLVKNWDFGSNGTIHDTASLIEEFQFHDQFGTIANGKNYGAVTVAATQDTAISAPNLGLPNDKQPVEQPGRPYREFTADSLKTYVRPLSETQTNASVSAHDAGNGSITAKWRLAKGGALLGKDLLWETRARMPKPAKAFWFALWTAGNKWDKGAEMDVLESFGTPNIYPPAAAFHVNSVGGKDQEAYSSWPSTLDKLQVPMADRNLEDWHVWTWVYLKDDSFKVYMDGYVVQTGSIHWTLQGSQGGEALDMAFLFDFGWGHTQISDVNISLAASEFPIEYEIDYSRVYLR